MPKSIVNATSNNPGRIQKTTKKIKPIEPIVPNEVIEENEVVDGVVTELVNVEDEFIICECGASYNADSLNCWSCGLENQVLMGKMRINEVKMVPCDVCGALIESDADFCWSCAEKEDHFEEELDLLDFDDEEVVEVVEYVLHCPICDLWIKNETNEAKCEVCSEDMFVSYVCTKCGEFLDLKGEASSCPHCNNKLRNTVAADLF